MANVPTTIGRYEIVKAIGHGGMGALYLAWDAKLERQIAIKVLKEDDPDLRERFAREAKSVARLRHPHIVTIFELGEHAEQPYIAMEYIHGRTLAQIIRDREDMPLGRTLELMAELCDGLAFAHRAGIIHRDVKPANIMVDEQGSLKILDFGIARLAESAGMTQAGAMIGTLNYMSPEQVTGLPADHRSDIFAVGLVFYELLAQKEAYPGSISTGILHRILHSEPVPLAEACPDLDEDVIRIVGRAIEKDANRRYQELTEMRRQILTVRAHVEAGDEVTRVRDTPSPHVPPKSSSARRASERGEIAQRRASQILHLLDQADRAVKEERYDSAIVACEHLLMLDSENVRALDLLDCARAAIEARPVNQQPSQAEGARVALQAKEAEASEPTIVRQSRSAEPVDLHLRHVPLPERETPPSARTVVQAAPQQPVVSGLEDRDRRFCRDSAGGWRVLPVRPVSTAGANADAAGGCACHATPAARTVAVAPASRPESHARQRTRERGPGPARRIEARSGASKVPGGAGACRDAGCAGGSGGSRSPSGTVGRGRARSSAGYGGGR